MRITLAPKLFERSPAALPGANRVPFPDRINYQDCSLIERTGEEACRGVTLVMVEKKQRGLA